GDIVIPVESIESATEENVLEYVVRDCDQSSLSLDLEASEDANITMAIDGTTYAAGVEIDLTDNSLTTVDIKVESSTGDKEQSYKLNISAPLKDNRLYYQRWNDVIAINRNPATNGGHNISDVQWYKQDGTSAGEGEFIVVSGTEDVNDYYPEVTTTTGDSIETVHKVCATIETKSSAKIIAYPNPVSRSEKVSLDLPESFAGSVLNIYDIKGSLVKSALPLPTKINSIDVSEFVPGIYLLQITSKDGNRETVKIVVN
ncbi:MAG: T9SS type A sorting domain-containing protein, partial [Prevotellaceae bacterium]|nr:T9SS type A sorting domain-containing protein [Prevotellaceae bacterium]